MPLTVIIPKRSKKTASCFTLREKVEMIARCKLCGEDPRVVMPPVYERHGVNCPRIAAQALSGFIKQFANRVAKGDSEAIALAKEFGFKLTEQPE